MDENTHTPVGTSFMRGFIDFEPDEGVGDGGGGAIDALAAVEPAAPAAEPAAAPAQPAPAAGLGVDDLRGTIFEVMEELLNQPAPPEPVQLPDYDPFNPDTVRAHTVAGVQELLSRELGPFKDLMGSIAEERGRAEATKALDDVAGEIGEFDRDQAIQGAAWLVSQGVQPRQAIRQAAEHTRAFEQRVREKVLAERTDALTLMHDPANADPAAGGAAAEVVDVPTGPNRYRIQLERSKAAHGLGPGVSVPTG